MTKKLFCKNPDRLVRQLIRFPGVIFQSQDGKYIQANASKGVVLATGDYENNPAIQIDTYRPGI